MPKHTLTEVGCKKRSIKNPIQEGKITILYIHIYIYILHPVVNHKAIFNGYIKLLEDTYISKMCGSNGEVTSKYTIILPRIVSYITKASQQKQYQVVDQVV